MKRAAFLGTGLMGAPMARHLAARLDVTVWNRNPARAEALRDVARVVATPCEAAAGVDLVIAMLLDGPVTEDVLGTNGAMAAAAPGALIVNMGSTEPDCDRRLAAQAESLGKRYLDAPVSGGVKGAEAASLAIFAGGSAADFAAALPVLQIFGRPTHMGPVGTGQVAKLANQLIVATTIGAVAEAFHLAESAGCSAATLREALRGGFADSRILDLHGARMVAGDYAPGGRVAAQLKDLRNVLDTARQSGLHLSLAETVTAGFADLAGRMGGADLDHAAYYLWLQSSGPAASPATPGPISQS